MTLRHFAHVCFRINIWKTLWFNFKKLPCNQAVKLPIVIYNKVIIRNILNTGGVCVHSDNIKTGMIRIGFRDMGIQDERHCRTILDLRKNSHLTFKGTASIGGGTRMYVKGDLIIGNNFYLSLNSQLIAHHKIQFGDDCTVGWNVLIMDTDFHMTKSYSNNHPFPMTSSIEIGNHCWICNGSQILKDTKLPEDCIVGAMSLCNKPYAIPSHSLIAGIPAVLKKRDITHVR